MNVCSAASIRVMRCGSCRMLARKFWGAPREVKKKRGSHFEGAECERHAE